VLRELDGESAVRRPVQPRDEAFDDLASHELDATQRGQIARLQKVGAQSFGTVNGPVVHAPPS